MDARINMERNAGIIIFRDHGRHLFMGLSAAISNIKIPALRAKTLAQRAHSAPSIRTELEEGDHLLLGGVPRVSLRLLSL